MKLSRRDFVHACCTAAIVSLTPHFMDRANATSHGISIGAPPTGFSQRNVINLNNYSSGTTEYAFIDHIKQGGFAPSSWTTGSTWPSLLDANGWPGDPAGRKWGAGFRIPDPANFSGPYRLKWTGNGRVTLNLFFNVGGVWATSNLVNCTGSAGSYLSTGGAAAASVDLTLSGTIPPGPVSVAWSITGSTGPFFIKNVQFYRVADETDLNNGLIFRSGWKQPLVNLAPSAIRCMNNLGGNNDRNCRFENRTLPSYVSWLTSSQWTASPSYPDASGTNQYTVAAATPTTGNPKNTPASMVHGEIVTCRITNGMVRGGSHAISAISNANPGVVTTATAHGFNTGDIVVAPMPVCQTGVTMNATNNVTIGSPGISAVGVGFLAIGPGVPPGTTVTNVSGSGLSGSVLTLSNATTLSGSITVAFKAMANLDYFPTLITVIDTTHYSIQTVGAVNIDTTGYGSFIGNSTCFVQEYISLQAGSGNDRVDYPVLFTDAQTPISHFSNYINALSYNTFYFSKTISGQSDGAGNPVMGAWIYEAAAAGQPATGASTDFPIEVMVQLINELNAMSPAHTIGMWMNIPCWNLSSMDPDYTTASDWAINAVDVVMNPNSTVRASGYSALGYSGSTQLNQPLLVVEYSNELWPSGTNDGRGYLIAQSWLRWPTIKGVFGADGFDWQDLKALRQVCWTRDVKASSPSNSSRIKYIMGLGPSGFTVGGDFFGNYQTVFGGTVGTPKVIGDWYTNDSLVTGGGWGQPISNIDGIANAPYIDVSSTTYTAAALNGTGTLTDDSAMYSGTDNSGTLSMTGGISAATISATITSGNPAIAATNTLVGGQAIVFGTTIGTNIVAGTTYYVCPFALSGSSFMIAPIPFPTLGSSIITPNGSGSPLATPSALTITAVAAGTPVVNQPLVGTGITTGTYVLGVSGSSPNYTLALSAIAATAGGTTIKSPANGGGNYAGAANQSQALTNFVTQAVNNSSAGTNFYVTAGAQFASLLPAGKVVLNYEGGTNWQTTAGQLYGPAAGPHLLTFADSAFMIAAIDSSQWGAAQTDFFNNYCAIAGGANLMPAVYIFTAGAGGQRWAYCSPDSYATISGTPTEGAALTVNSPVWVNASARNAALS